MDLLVEPVKTMLNKSCEAAASMIEMHTKKPTKIEIVEFTEEDGNTTALYLKMNGQVLFKHTFVIEDKSDMLDALAVMYGTLLTEMIATFCIVSSATLNKGKYEPAEH